MTQPVFDGDEPVTITPGSHQMVDPAAWVRRITARVADRLDGDRCWSNPIQRIGILAALEFNIRQAVQDGVRDETMLFTSALAQARQGLAAVHR